MGKPHDHHASKLPSSAISKLETTISLKVFIHCEGCRRKVKRIIKCVDGVESVNFEAENGKVIVSGKGVDAKEVLHNLHEAGKHAEIWSFSGGGKAPNMMNQPINNFMSNNRPTNNNNNNMLNNQHHHNTNNKNNNNINNNKNPNNMKAVGWEKHNNADDNKSLNHKGKGYDGSNFNGSFNTSGIGNTNFGGKAKSGGDMVELSSMLPPKYPNFPNGGFTPGGGHFEKPNHVAILSKNVAPMPSIYRGETSQAPSHEYASDDYATHLFSDENANNCRVM